MERRSYWTRSGSARITRRRALGAGLGAGAGLAAIAAVGCGDDDDSTDQGNATTATVPGVSTNTPSPSFDQNATLRAGIGTDVGSLDPQSVAGTGGGNFANQMTHFGGILTIDPESSKVSEFVASYEWTDNNSALLLKAKPRITFHNGEPVDAQALKFTIDRARGKPEYTTDFKSGQAALYAVVDRVEVIDPTTVKVVTSRADVGLPSRLAGGPYLVPPGYITERGDAAMATNPVGTGPFKFVSRTPDTELVSERFEGFWNARDAAHGPRIPFAKRLEQRVMPEAAARALAVEAGELHIAINIPPDLAKSYEGRRGFQVFYLPNDQPMHVQPNTLLESAPNGDPNPFRDVRVRKALNMAVDVDTIIKTVMTGREKRSYGFSSQTLGFPNDRLEQIRFKYDPAAAKALLEEAGYGDGFEVPFVGPAGRYPQSDEVMQAVAGYLAKIGIRTKIATPQYQAWVTEHQAGTWYGLAFLGVSGGVDPGANFAYGYAKGAAYGKSYDAATGVDEAMAKIMATFDEDERARLTADIIVKLYENATWLYLFEPVSMAVASDKVEWEQYSPVLYFPEYWNIRLKAQDSR